MKKTKLEACCDVFVSRGGGKLLLVSSARDELAAKRRKGRKGVYGGEWERLEIENREKVGGREVL
jgi:hypothetical protein